MSIACNCPFGGQCFGPRPHEECAAKLVDTTAFSRKQADFYVNLVSAYAHALDIILSNEESDLAEKALEVYFGSMAHYNSIRQALDDLNQTISLAREGRQDLVPELLNRLHKLIALMPGRAGTN